MTMTPNESSTIEFPSVQVFTGVGALLSDPGRWHAWLKDHPERAHHFAAAHESASRLGGQTGWSVKVVVERLGCDASTEKDLEDLSPERLTQCTVYWEWVESLVAEVETVLDKRLVVSGAARLFLLGGREVDRCDEALKTCDPGQLQAMEYLQLGEIAQAWDAASLHLGAPEAARVGRGVRENPFVDELAPHLSPKRLEMLASRHADDLLGLRTVQQMQEHLDLCKVCDAARRSIEAAASHGAVAA